MHGAMFRDAAAGSTTHIEQWLEKMLQISFRQQGRHLVNLTEHGGKDDIPRIDVFSSNTPEKENSTERSEKYFSQSFSALKEISLDRLSLSRCGVDKTGQDRIYRSLFVYCNGTSEFINEWQNVDKSLTVRLWDAFFRIFSFHDIHCRETFLQYLFDTQNHNYQLTIKELQESNEKLERENEQLLQELTLTQIALSSQSHERDIQLQTLNTTISHLRRKLVHQENELINVRKTNTNLEETLRESATAVAEIKETVPQLMHRLQRAMDDSHRSHTLTEHYRVESENFLNNAKKFDTTIKDLQDDLNKCRRTVIERNFLVDSLRVKEREQEEETKRLLTDNQYLHHRLNEQLESEEDCLSLIDQLVLLVNKTREQLASIFLAGLQCDRALSHILFPVAAPLFDDRQEQEEVVGQHEGNLWIDEESLTFCLRESTLPCRVRVVDVEEDVLKLENESVELETKDMFMFYGEGGLLLPAVKSTSSRQEKADFISSVREKIKFHQSNVLCAPQSIHGSEDASPQILDSTHQYVELIDTNKAICQKIDSDIQLDSNELFVPAVPTIDCSTKKPVQNVIEVLLADESLAARISKFHSPNIIFLAKKLANLLEQHENLKKDCEQLTHRLSISSLMNEGIYIPLIAKFFCSREYEHEQNSQLSVEFQSLRAQHEQLEQQYRGLLLIEKQFNNLEPKFFELVKHYQQRTEAKKEVDEALSEAKREIDELKVQSQRLHVCEERIEALSAELEEKLRIISEMQQDKKLQASSNKKQFR